MTSDPGSGHSGSGTPSGEEAPGRSRATGVGAPGESSSPSTPAAPSLRYRDGSGVQRVYLLTGNRPVTIGRAQAADLSLVWDRSVSSVHAEAYPLGTQWLISDEGISRNGTFINEERLTGRRRLHHGDVIRVGGTALTYDEAHSERRDATTVADSMSLARTVTLLFTDLVGSTELMDRLGDDATDRLRDEHFAILRAAAAEHQGREVKSLGDGLMVAFSSALSATACAAAMQQRIAAGNAAEGAPSLGLRIGLNAGEVISAEGDYFGTPVVVAKRLCDSASEGQVLSSEVVRALVGSRGGYQFIALGDTYLKGFSDPLCVFELDWRTRG